MKELFKQYTAAFDAFNPDAIAKLYRLPCAISDVDGVQTFTDKTALTAKFAANCENMKNFGYLNAHFNILQEQMLSPNEVVVHVGWRIVTPDSNIDFRTLYICHKLDDAWLIYSANVYEGSFENVS